MKKPRPTVTINFPPDLYVRLVKLAHASQRSFSGEVVWLVRAGLAAEERRIARALHLGPE